MAKNSPTKSAQGADGVKMIAQNRRARYEYEILDTFEAGLVLLGTEVKALREGKANLSDGFARLDGGEAFLYSVHIGHYEGGNQFNHDPERVRKLLLNRTEIERLRIRTEEKGLTIIPLKMFFRRGKAKVEVGIGRGKRLHDKRRDIAKRDVNRSIDRALAARQQGGGRDD